MPPLVMGLIGGWIVEKINAQTMEAVQSVTAIASATREQLAASSDIAISIRRTLSCSGSYGVMIAW